MARKLRQRRDKMKRLRELRKAMKLRQSDLAEMLGVSHATVGFWETGHAHPRASMLPKLAKVLGCTIDELLTEE